MPADRSDEGSRASRPTPATKTRGRTRVIDGEGYSGANARVFVGERHRPLGPNDLADRRPILDSGTPPEELIAMRRHQNIFIAGEGSKKPEVAVNRVERSRDDAYQAGWRINITLHDEQQAVVMPRVRAIRENPDVYRKGINPSIGYSGHRPEWIDMFYIPRLLPRRINPPMRRLNGRPMTPLWIFGQDARQLYRDASYPWGCIGLVTNSSGETGSGVLVGRNIVATAGHLVPWASGNDGWIKFVPDDFVGMGSLYGQNVFSFAVEVRGYNTNGNVTGYDWAILKLDQPLGDMIGYMGYNSYSDDWQDQNCWTVVGYPSGAGPFWQGGISINDDDEDSNDGQELESVTADTTAGNSGGPIFAWWGGDPRVIGIVSGEETEHVWFQSHQDNVFAAGPGFTNLIAWGRSNW
jgi:V8-like Glu-specific endopeptidase